MQVGVVGIDENELNRGRVEVSGFYVSIRWGGRVRSIYVGTNNIRRLSSHMSEEVVIIVEAEKKIQYWKR